MLPERVGNELAEHEHVLEGVKSGLFSMEVAGKGLPKSLVTVKVLLPAELASVLEHGAEGQAELTRRFAESGEEHLCRARRRPVV